MDRRQALLLCSLFVFCSLPTHLFATPDFPDRETHYISDFLIINIKDKLEKPYSVVTIVHSGDPVTLLSTEGNYYKIQTNDGKKGWISKQYVKKDIPKSLIIKRLRQEIVTLKNSLETNTSSQCDETSLEFKNTLSSADTRTKQLRDEIEQLQKALSSGSSLASVNQLKRKNFLLNTQLKQTTNKYSILVGEYEKRGEEIARLQNFVVKKDDKTRFYWFLAGASVFFFGLIAGKLGSRKKNKLIY